MHEPVLVLNANFEPINVCTTRRAVGLLLAGKADMVVNGRGHIRTVKQLLPRPSSSGWRTGSSPPTCR
jgi:hypothetical protein